MFPACAGMNRTVKVAELARGYVPRVRGDEPVSWANLSDDD